jgi:hypothetical protein
LERNEEGLYENDDKIQELSLDLIAWVDLGLRIRAERQGRPSHKGFTTSNDRHSAAVTVHQ